MATGNVYLYRMGVGVPGRVNREVSYHGEANQLDATNPPTAYGDPVKMGSNGKIQALASGDTSAAIYGFLEEPFPHQNTSYANQGFGAVAPRAGEICTIMKRGYMKVQLYGGTTPSKGAPVFVRVAGTPATGGRIDGLESVADGTPANTPQVGNQNTYFMGAPDANGITEIAYNI